MYVIRQLLEGDWDLWQPLWAAYPRFLPRIALRGNNAEHI